MPSIAAPRICRVAASTTTFMKPARLVRLQRARDVVIGIVAT